MFIKKKVQLIFIFFGSLLIFLSTTIDDISLGKFWYKLNPTSLVGFQGIFEKAQEKFYFLEVSLLISFLSYNLFLLIGIFLIVLSFFLNSLND